MKRYIYTAGALALTLTMSGLPVVALAESNSDDGLRVTAQVTAQTQGTNATTGVSVDLEDDNEAAREQQKQDTEIAREQQKQQLEASTTARVQEEDDDQEIELEMEDDQDHATSLSDLKKKIEVRRHELEDEVASTSPDHRDILENANPVRLAVHTLLSSKDLLGGIGSQVSEIAKRMNDSVATTTNAEAKVQARGFLIRLLFGGDAAAADVIAQQVAQNQQRIDDLTKLLNEANVSADIQVTLKAQIAAIQDAQKRLQDLAQREQNAWGLFSWRF